MNEQHLSDCIHNLLFQLVGNVQRQDTLNILFEQKCAELPLDTLESLI